MHRITPVALAFLTILAISRPASAHCDTTKGPVVTAAKQALDAGKPELVLHWVSPADEPAIRAAFEQAMKARAQGPAAKEVADQYFFETLVRIHRAGEGAPYTGLKQGDPEPIIAATDRALDTGSAAELEQALVAAVREGLKHRFAEARAARDFKPGDVGAGRAFVATYVPLTHWVEGVYGAASGPAEHHGAAAGHAAGHQAGTDGAGGHQAGNEEAAGHGSDGHGDGAGATTTHDGDPDGGHGGSSHLAHLPWIVAALLAVTVLIQGLFLIRRRRPAAA